MRLTAIVEKICTVTNETTMAATITTIYPTNTD